MIRFFDYIPSENSVAQRHADMSFLDFRKSTDDNFFCIMDDADLKIITSPNGEELWLKDVTDEQIVILFVNVLGLREAARE